MVVLLCLNESCCKLTDIVSSVLCVCVCAFFNLGDATEYALLPSFIYLLKYVLFSMYSQRKILKGENASFCCSS